MYVRVCKNNHKSCSVSQAFHFQSESRYCGWVKWLCRAQKEECLFSLLAITLCTVAHGCLSLNHLPLLHTWSFLVLRTLPGQAGSIFLSAAPVSLSVGVLILLSAL